MEIESKVDTSSIVMSQGPPPPNPLMVERFQSVVSSLFQQVRRGRYAGSAVTLHRVQCAALCIPLFVACPSCRLQGPWPMGHAAS